MNEKYVAPADLYPEGKIKPSTNGVIDYRAVSGNKAVFVIPRYTGMVFGQRIDYSIRGSGVFLGHAYVEQVDQPVEVSVYDISLRAPKVTAEYSVWIGGDSRPSHPATYDVINFPISQAAKQKEEKPRDVLRPGKADKVDLPEASIRPLNSDGTVNRADLLNGTAKMYMGPWSPSQSGDELFWRQVSSDGENYQWVDLEVGSTEESIHVWGLHTSAYVKIFYLILDKNGGIHPSPEKTYQIV